MTPEQIARKYVFGNHNALTDEQEVKDMVIDIDEYKKPNTMHKLRYFAQGNEICADDLKNRQQVEYLNLEQVSSLSGLKAFLLPFSGTYKGSYGVVSMQNGDRFYMDEEEYSKIVSVLMTPNNQTT